jgi:WhiB family redox-sensing transcriptional regulator
MLTITDWREISACRDSDPSLFFPIGTTGPAIEQIEAAKAICGECSVQEECVWGGYAEDERRRLRKRWLAERRKRAS